VVPLRRFSGAAAAAAITFVVILISSHLRSTQQNNYVRVAYAWLHGRMWIDWPGRWMDAVQYNGHYYGVDGPVPALFMLPSVLIWGNDANQTTVAIAFAAVATFLAWVLAERLGVTDLSTKVFLTMFFVAGTDVWSCAELGDVWFLAHLCAVAFVLGALVELCGKNRGWLVGVCGVLACGARFPEVAALPLEWLQHAQWPYVKPDPLGIALTFTSPALVLAFSREDAAQRRRRAVDHPGARRRTVVSLLSQRLDAVRHAAHAGFSAVPVRAHGDRRARPAAELGRRADHLVGAGRRVGRVVLEQLRADERLSLVPPKA
jgi:hypothetical protein